MARKKPKSEVAAKQRGIWKHDDPSMKVVDFSYESDILAQLVVDAWATPNLKRTLLDHSNQNNVRQELANRGIFLSHPVVLTEEEYEIGWQQDHEDEVVLVLPNDTRKHGGANLLETAKLLMAVTPNGI